MNKMNTSRDTFEKTQATSKTLSNSLVKSDRLGKYKEYPVMVRRNKDRFNQKQNIRIKTKPRKNIRNRFAVEEIREEDIIIEKQLRTKLKPKLRLFIDNELNYKGKNYRTFKRARSLEDDIEQLPQINEEQENHQENSCMHKLQQLYDRNEFNSKNQNSIIQQSVSKNMIIEIQEDIDEKQEILYQFDDSDDFNARSQNSNSNSLLNRSIKSLCYVQHNNMKRSRSCHNIKHIKVDEIDQKVRRKRISSKMNLELSDSIVEESISESEKESLICNSLSTDREFIKKILKGERISSNISEVSHNQIYNLNNQNGIDKIEEIYSSEDSQECLK